VLSDTALSEKLTDAYKEIPKEFLVPKICQANFCYKEIAQGLKPRTQKIAKAIFVPQKQRNSKGISCSRNVVTFL